MEIWEGSRTSSSDYSSQYSDSRRNFDKVIVAVDGSKELTRNALAFTVKNIVQPGDRLMVLGIIDGVKNPMGFKQGTSAIQFCGTNERVLHGTVSNMMDNYAKKLQLFSDLCDRNGVFLDIMIRVGPNFKSVILQQATELQATWIILDRHLKNDKKFYMNHLPCNVILLNEKDEAIHLRDCTGPCSKAERFQKCLSNIVLQDIYAQIPSPGSSISEAEENLSVDKIINEDNGCKIPESQIATCKKNFPAVISTDSAAEIQTPLLPEDNDKTARGAKITRFPQSKTLILVVQILAPLFVVLILVPLFVLLRD